jgi:hypothetical protein
MFENVLTTHKVAMASIFSILCATLENVFGINATLFALIFFGLVVETMLGVRLAIMNNEEIKSRKILYILGKMALILFLFYMITAIGAGLIQMAYLRNLHEMAGHIYNVGAYIQLFVTGIVCLYVLQSVLENWASLGNPIAQKLAKRLNVQIKKIENIADEQDITNP